MRVLVTGSRRWSDKEAIRRVLQRLPAASTIINGGAKGADSLAADIGRDLGFDVIAFPAEWHRFGKAAGVIRNTRMLEEGLPDLVLAFTPTCLESSPGTLDMVTKARKAGVRVIVFEDR
jgi:hypothetical protein